MVALVGVLAVLFARIHAADVRFRIVRIGDALLLCAVRLCALLIALAAPVQAASAGMAPVHWGPAALAVQASCAAVLVAVLELLAWAVGRRTPSRSAFGQGDVLLYAVCCLFVLPECLLGFLLLSSAVGAVMGLWQKACGQSTFPFAPAIVWPCLLFVLWEGFC